MRLKSYWNYLNYSDILKKYKQNFQDFIVYDDLGNIKIDENKYNKSVLEIKITSLWLKYIGEIESEIKYLKEQKTLFNRFKFYFQKINSYNWTIVTSEPKEVVFKSLNSFKEGFVVIIIIFVFRGI